MFAVSILLLFHICSSFRWSTPRNRASRCNSVVRVEIDERKISGYDILIERNCFNQLPNYLKTKKVLVVSNDVVAPLYLEKLKQILVLKNIEVNDVILPDGEINKSMEYLLKILDAAMECKLDRKSCMIALGGGVIGDMCGFAAAIYQRGVSFVQVPTTLMAMVDSAVGGKTAVNHEKGKNMIGAFYQPDAVLADLSTLETLPDREYRSGIAEIIKYGLIRDKEFFEWLESNLDLLLNRDEQILTTAIQRSCENKAEVVAADEKEAGLRATLNLGHTFGHAIEAGFGYGTWLHGEAVAAGTVMAAELSYELGLITADYLQRIINIFQRARLPTNLSNTDAITEVGADHYRKLREGLSAETFLALMSIDKKVAHGQLNLVLLEGDIGNAIITSDYDQDKLRNVVEKYCSERHH